jgi:hypothetical protein
LFLRDASHLNPFWAQDGLGFDQVTGCDDCVVSSEVGIVNVVNHHSILLLQNPTITRHQAIGESKISY